MSSELEIRPATPDRWDDVVAVAGSNGFYSGCWCAWWFVTSGDFDRLGAPGRRAILERLVADGEEPGLVAYRDGRPAGWVAVGPRERYGRLNRSPKLKPVDGETVWSIVCFAVPTAERGTGVATALLAAAVDHARERGARLVEGYPIDTSAGPQRGAAALYTGVLSSFERAGFVEIARRGGRPIVRQTTASD